MHIGIEAIQKGILMNHNDQARTGKQYTFDMRPGGMARPDDRPVEWIPLPNWDVVRYLPRYYGVGTVTDYDPTTDTVTASFYQGGWTAVKTGPITDFEFVRREEPGRGIDAFIK
jgi:hypothetical protein